MTLAARTGSDEDLSGYLNPFGCHYSPPLAAGILYHDLMALLHLIVSVRGPERLRNGVTRQNGHKFTLSGQSWNIRRLPGWPGLQGGAESPETVGVLVRRSRDNRR